MLCTSMPISTYVSTIYCRASFKHLLFESQLRCHGYNTSCSRCRFLVFQLAFIFTNLIPGPRRNLLRGSGLLTQFSFVPDAVSLVLNSDVGHALISLLRLLFFTKSNALSFWCCDVKSMNVLVERIYVYLPNAILWKFGFFGHWFTKVKYEMMRQRCLPSNHHKSRYSVVHDRISRNTVRWKPGALPRMEDGLLPLCQNGSHWEVACHTPRVERMMSYA
jgi:hypothetical protein